MCFRIQNILGFRIQNILGFRKATSTYSANFIIFPAECVAVGTLSNTLFLW